MKLKKYMLEINGFMDLNCWYLIPSIKFIKTERHSYNSERKYKIKNEYNLVFVAFCFSFWTTFLEK